MITYLVSLNTLYGILTSAYTSIGKLWIIANYRLANIKATFYYYWNIG